MHPDAQRMMSKRAGATMVEVKGSHAYMCRSRKRARTSSRRPRLQLWRQKNLPRENLPAQNRLSDLRQGGFETPNAPAKPPFAEECHWHWGTDPPWSQVEQMVRRRLTANAAAEPLLNIAIRLRHTLVLAQVFVP